jgi:hypothetical protein
MKNPWVIGLLSIVPGLGLVVLGEIQKGLGAFVLALLGLVGTVAPWEILQGIGLAFFTIVWFYQGYYAFVVAQRLARAEAGLALPERQLAIAPLSPGASSEEKALHDARQTVAQILRPDEHVRVALRGATLESLSIRHIIWILLGNPYSRERDTYLGITDQDLVLVSTDPFGKPSGLRRIPLNQVSLQGSKESRFRDEVIIGTGEGEPLRLVIGSHMRQGTRQLVEMLSRTGRFPSEAEDSAREDRSIHADHLRPSSSATAAEGIRSRHPVVFSALLGACGGIAGAAASLVLTGLLSALGGEALTGGVDPTEALGFLMGAYCLVMFPSGGAIAGAIPGAIVGALRASRARNVTAIPPLLAGFFTVVIPTLVGVVAMLVALPW